MKKENLEIFKSFTENFQQPPKKKEEKTKEDVAKKRSFLNALKSRDLSKIQSIYTPEELSDQSIRYKGSYMSIGQTMVIENFDAGLDYFLDFKNKSHQSQDKESLKQVVRGSITKDYPYGFFLGMELMKNMGYIPAMSELSSKWTDFWDLYDGNPTIKIFTHAIKYKKYNLLPGFDSFKNWDGFSKILPIQNAPEEIEAIRFLKNQLSDDKKQDFATYDLIRNLQHSGINKDILLNFMNTYKEELLANDFCIVHQKIKIPMTILFEMSYHPKYANMLLKNPKLKSVHERFVSGPNFKDLLDIPFVVNKRYGMLIKNETQDVIEKINEVSTMNNISSSQLVVLAKKKPYLFDQLKIGGVKILDQMKLSQFDYYRKDAEMINIIIEKQTLKKQASKKKKLAPKFL